MWACERVQPRHPVESLIPWTWRAALRPRVQVTEARSRSWSRRGASVRCPMRGSRCARLPAATRVLPRARVQGLVRSPADAHELARARAIKHARLRMRASRTFLQAARAGDEEGLRDAAAAGWDACTARDTRGAGALLWAAGGGHLGAVRVLCEELGVDPRARECAQRGRRSYAGRTALHWAARNGHIRVCRYLVEERGCDVNAATDDGTTAFAWASWTGQIEVRAQ